MTGALKIDKRWDELEAEREQLQVDISTDNSALNISIKKLNDFDTDKSINLGNEFAIIYADGLSLNIPDQPRARIPKQVWQGIFDVLTDLGFERSPIGIE